MLRQSPFSLLIETVVFLLKHDFPELFFVKGIESMERISDFLCLVKPSYRLSLSAAVETLCRIGEVVEPLLEEAKQVTAIDETLEFLHYTIAEDVLLSNMMGSTLRMYYDVRRDELSKWGNETPFGFVNEYAPDLREGRKGE